ncbi:hypothetical protein GCM10011608_53830 [Micromonospora sonchi]|uniref:Uncharacterized protein n=1 Tax=Micromonospora sonchi TaxID=1763543 RepID=A0A917X3M2_9ACTN|nr:hypothetical protein [Micromonospora sonchi]GGM61931.1 hypothetical protein GCM10011608_53830 [Micromonospora sonchi]
MFVTDSEFFLSLHRTHANELRAEAARERLARTLPRRSARDWLTRRRRPTHSEV